MSTRTRKPEMRLVGSEGSAEAAERQHFPFVSTTLFCDDVRVEANGKLLLVGCYPGNVILTSPQQPIDRLWVYTRLNWLPRADPVELRLRIDLPAQAPCMMMVQPCIGPQNGLAKTSSCVWQLRFHPLRAGDTLRVWAEFEGGQLSCGDLLAITPEAATRH